MIRWKLYLQQMNLSLAHGCAQYLYTIVFQSSHQGNLPLHAKHRSGIMSRLVELETILTYMSANARMLLKQVVQRQTILPGM